jgi:betaine-aldehyde dehydrogenase
VFKYYADLAAEFDAKQEEDIKIGDARFRSISRKEAVGVVGAVIPWNFPLLMLAWKVLWLWFDACD